MREIALSEPAQPPPEPVSLKQATRYWLKLGLTSFGGPAGQIAMMHQELVEKRRWISEHRFLHGLNYCMVLPGPEAQQLATYIGWLMHGRWGGIVAGGLFVLPSLFIIAGLSWLYMTAGAAITRQALYGVKPAVVAIVLFAAWRIGKKVLKRPELWAISLAAFLPVLLLKLPYPVIVLAAGAIGWMLRHRLAMSSAETARHVLAKQPALIDDDTPVPIHARYSRERLALVLFGGVAIWAAAMLAVQGLDHSLGQMARFFTQAALLTFGGAYAVMPYVFQGAVEHYHWLTPAQMLDGLALGETTPGPLIMVVAFIGFVGGWTHGIYADLAMGGVLGACTATFFTFLPSFVFILAGAPLVERMREDFSLSGPLSAITAAVVGTIVYLAVYLGGHVFWPGGAAASVDWFAVLLAAGAWWLLYREKLGMIPLILICGLAGFVVQWLGHGGL
jgi:chromate transporter